MADIRMLQQGVFDLSGISVEATDDEHVLSATDDAQVALVVDDTEVAGAQPSVCGQRVPGGLRIIEVVRHHTRPAHGDLTGRARVDVGARTVDDAHLEPGPGPTDG